MHFSLAFAVTTLIAFASAKPVPETHVVHEKRGLPHHVSASQWVKRDRVDKRAILPMRIGLVQSNLHKGHDWLMDV